MNELTVTERAHVALGSDEHEKNLVVLSKKFGKLDKITNADGYKDANSARLELKNARVDLEKKGKAAREDATAFSKAVIAEEKRLVGIIEPEEDRITKLQKEWDDRLESEKQENILLEVERVEAIKKRIEAIRRLPVESNNIEATSDSVGKAYVYLDQLEITEDVYQEFTAQALDVRIQALEQLRSLADAIRAREEAAKQAEIDRVAFIKNSEELAQLKAEIEERNRIETEAKEEQARQEVLTKDLVFFEEAAEFSEAAFNSLKVVGNSVFDGKTITTESTLDAYDLELLMNAQPSQGVVASVAGTLSGNKFMEHAIDMYNLLDEIVSLGFNDVLRERAIFLLAEIDNG